MMACIVTKTYYAVVVTAVLMAILTPQAAAVTCGDVVRSLSPCLTYLRNGGQPPAVCCNGVRGLRNAARNTADLRTICNCLKGASSSYRGVSGNYAATLPGKCRVNIPYKISPSTDCSRIH